MSEHGAGAAPGRWASLILCALLSALAYIVVKPEQALGGISPPPVFDTCEIAYGNCAKITAFAGGNGNGTITSSPEGINCTVSAQVRSGTCEYSFIFSESSLTVTVTYTPAAGSSVYQRGMGPFPIGNTLFNLSDGDLREAIYHEFVLTRHTLSVTKTGAGTGSVILSPGIECASSCEGVYDYGTQVSLTATPDAGAVFKTWTGACAGQGATCTLTIQAATATNVVFELPGVSGGGGGGGGTETALGANTSGTSGAATSNKTDKAVAAGVVRTRSSKSPLGKRILQLELNLEENVSATLTLRRGKKTLLTKQLTRIRPGNRLLTLVIPKRVGKGKATLVFKLTDPAGNTLSGRRAVKIATL